MENALGTAEGKYASASSVTTRNTRMLFCCSLRNINMFMFTSILDCIGIQAGVATIIAHTIFCLPHQRNFESWAQLSLTQTRWSMTSPYRLCSNTFMLWFSFGPARRGVDLPLFLLAFQMPNACVFAVLPCSCVTAAMRSAHHNTLQPANFRRSQSICRTKGHVGCCFSHTPPAVLYRISLSFLQRCVIRYCWTRCLQFWPYLSTKQF